MQTFEQEVITNQNGDSMTFKLDACFRCVELALIFGETIPGDSLKNGESHRLWCNTEDPIYTIEGVIKTSDDKRSVGIYIILPNNISTVPATSITAVIIIFPLCHKSAFL